MASLPTEHALPEMAVRSLEELHPDISVASVVRDAVLPERDVDLLLRFELRGRTYTTVVELQRTLHPSSVAPVSARLAGLSGHGHPAVVAPYVTPATFEACRDAGLSAWDLCGNAHVDLPGLYIRVQGEPNRFVTPKEARSVFSPKASRIARLLLGAPGRARRVTALAAEGEIDKGYTSRVVSKLIEMQMVAREEDGTVRLVDPGLLLDCWADEYRPSSRRPARYYAGLGDPMSLLREIGERTAGASVQWAATGPAAAHLVEPSLRVAEVHLFWSGSLEPLEAVEHLQPAEGGADVFVFDPYDEFAFHDGRVAEGVPVVSDVQLFLDLRRAGGRAGEQAGRFRQRILGSPAPEGRERTSPA